MASQRVGAGEGNRTLDIQLGKLACFQADQQPSCKTAAIAPQALQKLSGDLQNFSHARHLPCPDLNPRAQHVAIGCCGAIAPVFSIATPPCTTITAAGEHKLGAITTG